MNIRQKRRRVAYRAKQARRERMIGWAVAIFFITVNLLLAWKFWPQVYELQKAYQSGEKKAPIHITLPPVE